MSINKPKNQPQPPSSTLAFANTNHCCSIDFSHISTLGALYAALSDAFGFPEFFGHNIDAVIDCLFSLPYPADGMTEIHLADNESLVIQAINFTNCQLDIQQALLIIISAVNTRWQEKQLYNAILLYPCDYTE